MNELQPAPEPSRELLISEMSDERLSRFIAGDVFSSEERESGIPLILINHIPTALLAYPRKEWLSRAREMFVHFTDEPLNGGVLRRITLGCEPQPIVLGSAGDAL